MSDVCLNFDGATPNFEHKAANCTLSYLSTLINEETYMLRIRKLILKLFNLIS